MANFWYEAWQACEFLQSYKFFSSIEKVLSFRDSQFQSFTQKMFSRGVMGESTWVQSWLAETMIFVRDGQLMLKCIILAYFSKNLTNHSWIFRGFGQKTQIIGNLLYPRLQLQKNKCPPRASLTNLDRDEQENVDSFTWRENKEKMNTQPAIMTDSRMRVYIARRLCNRVWICTTCNGR